MALNLNLLFNGAKKLREWWPIVKTNLQQIEDTYNNHVNGASDRHTSDKISYTGSISGATNVKEGLDNLVNRVDAIITSPAEGVTAQEIIDARKGKASLGAKIDAIDTESVYLQEEEPTGTNSQTLWFAVDSERDFSGGGVVIENAQTSPTPPETFYWFEVI